MCKCKKHAVKKSKPKKVKKTSYKKKLLLSAAGGIAAGALYSLVNRNDAYNLYSTSYRYRNYFDG